MLLQSIQDYIRTTMDGEIALDAFIAKVRAVVGNLVAMMAKPTPMDIGHAATDLGREDYSEVDVHAVSASPWCYTGDRWGHVSRECPSVAHETGEGGEKGAHKAKDKGKDGGFSVVASMRRIGQERERENEKEKEKEK